MHDWLSVIIPAAGALAAALGRWLWKKTRKSKSVTEVVDTYTGYVGGTARTRLKQFLSPLFARQFSVRIYAKRALESFPKNMPVPSIQGVQLNIDKTYVPLAVATGDGKTMSAESFLLSYPGRSFNSYLIFGEPGSGKSTFTKYHFRQACQRLRFSRYLSPVPIHVELGKLDWTAYARDVATPWLISRLEANVQKIRGVHGTAFVFRAFVEGGALLILLDGLDEVPLGHLRDCCEAIDDAREYIAGFKAEGTQLVVTGRVQLRTLLDSSFIARFNRTLEIKGLNSNSIFLFLGNWPFPANVAREAARVFSNIQRSASLRQMCSNPLVLSMYVARDQLYGSGQGERSVRLPDNRTEFYGEIVKELILYRRDENIGSISAGSYAKRWRQEVLAKVALAHMQTEGQPANSLSWESAVNMIADDRSIPAQEADEEFRRIAIETGIISEERRGESFRFLHLTVCEYLAARELVDQGGDAATTFVRDAARQIGSGETQRLTEVAIFSTCLVPRNDRKQLLDWFISQSAIDSRLLLRLVHESGDLSTDRVIEVRKKVADEICASEESELDVSLLESLLSLCADSFRQGVDGTLGTCPPIGDVVEEIVGSDPEKFTRAFPSYFSHSPEVAVADAKRRGLEQKLLEPKLLSYVISGPDGVEYAKRLIASSQVSAAERERWIVALVESALRYTLVAHILAETPEEVQLTNPAMNGRATRWALKGPVAGRLYGSLLAFALSEIDSYEKGAQRKLYKVGLLNYTDPTGASVAQVLNLKGGEIMRGRVSSLYVVAPLGGVWTVWGMRDREGKEVELAVQGGGGTVVVKRNRDNAEPVPVLGFYSINTCIEFLMKMDSPRPVSGFNLTLKGNLRKLRKVARAAKD